MKRKTGAVRKSRRSRAAHSKRYWVIARYDSLKEVYSKKRSIAHFDDRSIRLCLQALCAATLDPDEIIGACASRGANKLLDVHCDRRKNTYQCGENPHFTARQMDITAGNASIKAVRTS